MLYYHATQFCVIICNKYTGRAPKQHFRRRNTMSYSDETSEAIAARGEEIYQD